MWMLKQESRGIKEKQKNDGLDLHFTTSTAVVRRWQARGAVNGTDACNLEIGRVTKVSIVATGSNFQLSKAKQVCKQRLQFFWFPEFRNLILFFRISVKNDGAVLDRV